MRISGAVSDWTELEAFLGSCLDRKVRITDMSRLEGGWSRQLHRVVLDTGEVLALRGEVAHGVLETDIEREYRILSALEGSGVPLPGLFGFEGTATVLGHRFIAMQWVAGKCLNLWRVRAEDQLGGIAGISSLARSWTEDIAVLHKVDVARLRSAGVDPKVTASAYVEAEVAAWSNQLRSSDRHPGPLVEEACTWLEHHIPAPAAETSVVHGDLRLGNMIVDDGAIAAFLDWEMAGLGDWRADVGYSLMPYNAGKFLDPIRPSWNQLMEPRHLLARYGDLTGRTISEPELVFFIVLGCVKMIGILTTGVGAYRSGRSNDPRLAWVSLAIPGLVEDACSLIDRGLPW